MTKRGRGRPPKPKIEIEKNRVGRPNYSSLISLDDKRLIMSAWRAFEQSNPPITKEKRRKIIADKLNLGEFKQTTQKFHRILTNPLFYKV